MEITTGATRTILSKLYEDVDNENVRKVGYALGEVFEHVPLSEFLNKLDNENIIHKLKKLFDIYLSALDEISDEEICFVETEIGIPILERFMYMDFYFCSLYMNILVKSSFRETRGEIWSPFIYTIEKLSLNEIDCISQLRGKESIPYIKLYLSYPNTKPYTIDYYSWLEADENEPMTPDPSLHIVFLQAAGIISDKKNTNLEAYRKDFNNLKSEYLIDHRKKDIESEGGIFQIEESYYDITDYGKMFINACTFEGSNDKVRVPIDYQSLIGVNQTWKRGSEYFTIKGFEGRSFIISTNVWYLNPSSMAEVQIDMLSLITYLMHEPEEFELID